MSKGHSENPIQVDLADDMEGDREWDDIEVEVRNQFPQHRSAPAASEVEGLYQVVPLATGRTLGMALRPRRGGRDGRGGNDGLENG